MLPLGSKKKQARAKMDERDRRKQKMYHTDDDDDQSDVHKEEEEEEERSGQWSSLTDDLLLSILSRLQTLEDLFAFRGVCTYWRSLAAPLPSLDLMSSQCPLILIGASHRMQALYDISHKRLYSARPPWDTDSRYAVAYSHGYVITSSRSIRPTPLLWSLFTEAIVSFPRAPFVFGHALLTANPSSPGCLLVLLDLASSVLQFCRPGERRWTVHHWNANDATQLTIAAVIFFNNSLYALNIFGQLGVMNLAPHPVLTLLEAKAPSPLRRDPRSSKLWLAEARGELLLVCCSFGRESTRFELWRWEFASSEWVGTGSLGGWTLFLNHNGFAASLQPSHSALKPDCIYYSGLRSVHWRVYSLVDGSLEVVSPDSSSVEESRIPLSPVWVFPSLCL